MRRIAGVALFFTGFGMGLMFFFPMRISTVILIMLLLLCGYHMIGA